MKKLLLLIMPLVLLLSCNSPFGNNTDRLKYTGTVNASKDNTTSVRLKYHILQINVDGDGYVLLNGKEYISEMKFLKGTKVKLEAIATFGSGQEFTGWDGSVSSVESKIEVVMDNDITLTASFVVPTVYKKLFLTIRKGGGVSINGEMIVNLGDTSLTIERTYIEGEDVILRAVPNDPAIVFGGWSGNDHNGSVNSTALEIRVVLNMTVSLTASFSTEKFINIVNTPHSKIAIKIDSVDMGERAETIINIDVEVGDKVELTVIALTPRYYEFGGWTGGISSSNPIINITVGNSLNLEVIFNQVMRTLTINQVQGQAMTYKVNVTNVTNVINPAPNTAKIEITYPIDTIVNVELVEKYYPFISWSGAGSGSSKTVSGIKLEENKTLNATFETGVFDVYDNPDINWVGASKFDNTWTIRATFDNKEIPTYTFINGTWASDNASLNGYVTSGANTIAQENTVSSVKYFQYREKNYYKSSDGNYHVGLEVNKFSRFRFYRFTGAVKVVITINLDNALCAVDTYTKLVYPYAVPTAFGTFGNPTKWEAIEVKENRGGFYTGRKFYEYDPIGYVESDGTVILFDSFKTIQSGAAGKKKWNLYMPSITPTAPVELDIIKLNNTSVIRSPYY